MANGIGWVVAIAIKPHHEEPMREIDSADVTEGAGFAGDVSGKGGWLGKRQITVISAEQWHEACAEVGVNLPWTARRANLLVQGLRFGPSDVGKCLRLGRLILEITGETKPCGRMDLACPGLRAALTPDWRAGVTCRVLRSGHVRKNGPVILE